MSKVILYDIKDRITGREYHNLPLGVAAKLPEIEKMRFAAWSRDRSIAYGGDFVGVMYKGRYIVSRKTADSHLTGEEIMEITRRWEDAVRPFRELQKRRDERLWAESMLRTGSTKSARTRSAK